MKANHLSYKMLLILFLTISIFALMTGEDIITIKPNNVLQIDCKRYNLKGTECSAMISNFIQAYTGNSQTPGQPPENGDSYPLPAQGYSAMNIPQDTRFPNEGPERYPDNLKNSTTLNLFFQMQVNQLTSLTDASRQLDIKASFLVVWVDPNLAFNASIVDFNLFDHNGNGFVYLSKDWIWMPDIIITSSGQSLGEVLSYKKEIQLYPNGMVVWYPSGASLTSQCNVDLQNFPFDIQVCAIRFASSSNVLNFGYNMSILNSVEFPAKATNYIDSLSWQTVDITYETKLEVLIGNQQSAVQPVVTYYITLQRNNIFYWNSAIIPLTFVCCLALGSLFLDDFFELRLTVIISVMLIVVAIQWSVALSLPVTATRTWMDNFYMWSYACTFFCAMETCLIISLHKWKQRLTTYEYMLEYMFKVLGIIGHNLLPEFDLKLWKNLDYGKFKTQTGFFTSLEKSKPQTTNNGSTITSDQNISTLQPGMVDLHGHNKLERVQSRSIALFSSGEIYYPSSRIIRNSIQRNSQSRSTTINATHPSISRENKNITKLELQPDDDGLTGSKGDCSVVTVRPSLSAEYEIESTECKSIEDKDCLNINGKQTSSLTYPTQIHEIEQKWIGDSTDVSIDKGYAINRSDKDKENHKLIVCEKELKDGEKLLSEHNEKLKWETFCNSVDYVLQLIICIVFPALWLQLMLSINSVNR